MFKIGPFYVEFFIVVLELPYVFTKFGLSTFIVVGNEYFVEC